MGLSSLIYAISVPVLVTTQRCISLSLGRCVCVCVRARAFVRACVGIWQRADGAVVLVPVTTRTRTWIMLFPVKIDHRLTIDPLSGLYNDSSDNRQSVRLGHGLVGGLVGWSFSGQKVELVSQWFVGWLVSQWWQICGLVGQVNDL